MNGRIALLIEYNLGYATAITQIDEKQIAVIAAPVYPAHEHGFFT